MIEGVPEGEYALTVEKGQFRRRRRATITADQITTADTEWTTLPSYQEPEAGDMTPRIAMVLGRYDKLQYVLSKLGIGIGILDRRDWRPGTAINRVDV